MDKKRCKTLYRVSTLKQIEKGADIPLQEQAGREFCEHMGWNLIEEKYERGVSGFKVSATKRDAILELQEEALKGEFDVLLVFMFDRLGRKEDETPFVVKWFVEHGIEVWSVKEGQQKFEEHVDDLINYIRFWQASGESKKTSIRVAERMGQLVQEGRYTGGYYAYGYKIVKMGRLNKKNYEVHDIQIDEYEASIVNRVFDLADTKGYGGRRITSILTSEGIFNRDGKPFAQSTINNMLDNSAYLGVLKSGNTISKIHPDLQIVDVDKFERVHKLRQMRKQKDKDKKNRAKNENYTYKIADSMITPENLPIPTDGKGLLSGLIFCGHCGLKLRTKTRKSNSRLPRNHPENKLVTIYVCENRLYEKGKVNACVDGQSTYVAHKIDEYIDKLVKEILNHIEGQSEFDYISIQHQKEIKTLEAELSLNMSVYKKTQVELESLKKKFITACVNDDDTAFFMGLIKEHSIKLTAIEESVSLSRDALQKKKDETCNLKNEYNQLVAWAEVYDTADIAARRMIVSNIIEKVTVKKDYKLDITLKINRAQHEQGLDFGMENTKTIKIAI